MSLMGGERTRGRAWHRDRAWKRAAGALQAADAADELSAEDLTSWAEAAFLSGDTTGSVQAFERAFAAHRAAGRFRPAARAALSLGQVLGLRGASAAAAGWLGRAAHALDEADDTDCAERGYLLMPAARAHFASQRYTDALAVAQTAEACGHRHGDRDLVVYARHSQGRSWLRLEHLDEGLAALDEIFVEVFPAGLRANLLTGLVACSAVEGCQQVGAYDRAAEWTAALSAWCDEQPELIQFSAECLVHRSEVLLRRGFWTDALSEATAAQQCAERDGIIPMQAAARYRRGEALRLLGRPVEAEQAYLQAQEAGYDPQPGLAVLRLLQHRHDAAISALRRALAVTEDPLRRAELLPAAVDAFLAGGQCAEASTAAAELTDLAVRWPSAGLQASARQAQGAVALLVGRPAVAAGALDEAWRRWADQQAPYQAAHARSLLGLACSALGDLESAKAHERAAAAAVTALEHLPGSVLSSSRRGGSPAPFGLTPRESQVLGLVAAGLTNRNIAGRLVLSERTVDRHVSNILGKLGVSSRTAAASAAFRHGLS